MTSSTSPVAQPVSRYGVGSDAYLARAKLRLEEETAEALFYAAFELRCYVEARQDDYLDAQGKVLDRIFDSKQIQYFEFEVPDHKPVIGYHVFCL